MVHGILEMPSQQQPDHDSSQDFAEAGEDLFTAGVGDDSPASQTSATNFESLPRFPHPLHHPLRAAAWVVHLLFGVASLFALLAVTAAIPLGNLFALGYLLEVQGRVVRTGRLRASMPLIPLASRAATIILGVGVWLLPLWFVSDVALDARLIAPGSTAAWLWTMLQVAMALGITVHLCLALARGGSVGCFVRPIKNALWLRKQLKDGDYWTQAGRQAHDFLSAARFPYHFWLGARGYIGTIAWLLIPVLLFTTLQDATRSWQWLLMLIGAFCLLPVLSWLPFLQARFAAEGRWQAMFEWRDVRELFRHAPLSWTLATIALYASTLPLYLYMLYLKMRLPPHAAMWDVMLVILLTMYPAKIIVAWAYRQATQRPPAHAAWRWISRPLLVAALGAYVYILFYTQILGDHGRRALLEHHALVLPFSF